MGGAAGSVRKNTSQELDGRHPRERGDEGGSLKWCSVRAHICDPLQEWFLP